MCEKHFPLIWFVADICDVKLKIKKIGLYIECGLMLV